MHETRADEMDRMKARKYEDALLDWEIQTMWSIWLGLKVSWLTPFVGQDIGETGRKIDAFGHQLLAANLPGDHWRKRHDKCKLFLYKLMQWAKMECSCEVYNEFARFISTNLVQDPNQTPQNRWNGKCVKDKQGMVPDLKGKADKAQKGSAKEFLGEVKTLNGGARYLNAGDERRAAVEKRAKLIHKEYINKAIKIDAEYNNVADGGGPVHTHMLSVGRIRCLVFGRQGEWSDDVEVLVRLCTNRIAEDTWKEAGFRCEGDARAIIFNYVIKKLAILSLRAVAVLLRDRREGIGSSDGGVSKKHVQGALQLAENAALDHASMVQHLRR